MPHQIIHTKNSPAPKAFTWTNGNPFFTVLMQYTLCSELQSVQRRTSTSKMHIALFTIFGRNPGRRSKQSTNDAGQIEIEWPKLQLLQCFCYYSTQKPLIKAFLFIKHSKNVGQMLTYSSMQWMKPIFSRTMCIKHFQHFLGCIQSNHKNSILCLGGF